VNHQIDGHCPKCGKPVDAVRVGDREIAGYCPHCNTPVVGSILPRSEDYKGHYVEAALHGDNFRAHVMKIGGGLDWTSPENSETQDAAIAKGKDFVDGIPGLDWV